MTPEAFIKKWRSVQNKERSASQEHFIDLLRGCCHDPQVVAHFLNRLLFCLFAEDVGLLPEKLVTRLFEGGIKAPDRVKARLGALLQAMSREVTLASR